MRCALLAVLASTGLITIAACSSSNDAPPAAGVDAGNDAITNDAPVFVGDVVPAGCVPSAANFDVPGNGCDDDNDGIVDNGGACDDGLPVTGDASLFARAIDLCQVADDDAGLKWGVVSIEYKGSFSTGTEAEAGQHGIVPKFGNVVLPRAGKSLGVLSTGWAREYDNPQGSDTNAFKGGVAMQPPAVIDDAPPGFPKDNGDCTVDPTAGVHDVIDVKIRIKVPANARGITFDFDFWSSEWPDYVCTKYNDAFIAYLTSSGFNGGAPDNISFDSQKSPVSVNNGFFDRCTPNSATGCGAGATPKTAACPGGESELGGTGFLDKGPWCDSVTTSGGGATGWLTSSAPVTPGETITIELILWDTGDQNYDSSVLIDHFAWLADTTQTGTQRPPR